MLEIAMDEMAEKLGMDPVEFRIANDTQIVPDSPGKPKEKPKALPSIAVNDPAKLKDHVDRSLRAPKFPADHSHSRPVIIDDFRDVATRDVLISRRCHLQRRRQIRPELKPVHSP